MRRSWWSWVGAGLVLAGATSPGAAADSEVKTRKSLASEKPKVQVHVELDRTKIAAASKQPIYSVTYLEVVGGERPDRKPLALSIVLDVSGSMEGEKKLQNVVAATQYVVDRLGKDDRVAIVAYSSGTQKVYLPDGAPDAAKAKAALAKLTANGGTNMEAGLRLGLEHLKGLGVEKSAKRLLLLSDGRANQGISTIEGLSKIAEGVRELGGSVSTFGVGADYNEDLMAKIAEAAGGNYHVIDKGAELAEVFQKEFDELGSLVGSQVRLRLDIPEGLEVVEAFGYPIEAGAVVLRDLYFKGMKTKVVLKLKVTKEAPKKGEAKLSQTLVFADAQTAAENTVPTFVPFEWTDSAKEEQASTVPRVVAVAEEVKGARELDLASRAYASGDAKKARALLKSRIQRNIANQESLGADAGRLMEQNAVLEKVQQMFDQSGSDSRAGKAAVKWSKQSSRMQSY